MDKKRKLILTITVLFIGLIITGASYAFWTVSSNNKSIVFNTASNLRKYITYDDGEGIFSGSLQVGENYSSGIHTTISVSKSNEASRVTLTGTIYMDINAIGTNMQNSSALKWAVTSGTSSNIGSLLAQGNFMGASAGDTLTLYPSFAITTTVEYYTIWIWLDEEEYPSEALSGETLDTNVWTEINQIEGVNEQFTVTQINANYQTITATAVNNKHNINGYKVTTSSSEPNEWETIASPSQIYNLPAYSNTQVGETYYVWFKDTEGHTTSNYITISASDTTKPECSFGTWSPSSIGNGETSTISLTCTDSGSGIVNSNIKTSDLTVNNENMTVTNISKESTTNGYIYTITVTGNSNVDVTDSLTLAANVVKDGANNGNASVTSGNITIGIPPTLTVSVENGNVYAKSKVATITIADNQELAAGTYTIKYGWSTTNKTCAELTDTTTITVASGESMKSANVTISGETGEGSIYVCNPSAITDAQGKSLASNTIVDAVMYLDNTGPTATLTLNVLNTLAINAALTNISDSNTSVSTPYYYAISQDATCTGETYTDSTNTSYSFTGITDAGTYYVCAKLYDSLENETIVINNVDVKAYLRDLSGNNAYFRESAYSDKITKIQIVNKIDLTNAVSGKDPYILDNYNSGMIKGWLEQNDVTNNTYDLYIGANSSTIYATNLYYAFSYMKNVSLVNLDGLNTSNVTDMSSMFIAMGRNATNFSLDLGSEFNTSNVTNMSQMFSSMGSSANNFSLDLGSEFNTSNVTNMSYMFATMGRSANNFSLDLGSEFNTSKVTNMSSMFSGMGYWSQTSFTLDLAAGDFNKVSSAQSMFVSFPASKATILVKDATAQNWIITQGGTGFSATNVLIKGTP